MNNNPPPYIILQKCAFHTNGKFAIQQQDRIGGTVFSFMQVNLWFELKFSIIMYTNNTKSGNFHFRSKVPDPTTIDNVL
jgi:hypothetical protein